MHTRIGNVDSTGDTLVHIDRRGKLAMYRHRKGGYSIYLYESSNWHLNDEWLLKAYRNTREAADEHFSRIDSALL